MTTFQLVTLPLFGVMFIAIVAVARRRRMGAGVASAWIALCGIGAVFVAFPQVTASLAAMLGIGRGADLVFYTSILFMFAALFRIYLQFRRIDQQMTEIVRRIAILSPEGAAQAGPPREHSRSTTEQR